MKSSDLNQVLEKFMNSTHRSILIDGPWGCGKTFQLKEFIKKCDKKKFKNSKIYYLSLFGTESIDEINTSLYSNIHKTKKVIKNSLSVISKAISPIPKIGKVTEAIEYAINSKNCKLKIKDNKNYIIIFDDLERISSNLDYVSVMGYFNQLFLSKAHIICACSSLKIEDTTRKKEFHEFKEKVFDRIYVIDESEEDIIRGYFEKEYSNDISNFICEFHNNIRKAQKTSLFIEEIISRTTEKDYNIFDKISYPTLLRSCIKTINLVFESHDKPDFIGKKIEPKESYKSIEYQNDVEAMGENLANGLYHLYNDEKTKISDPNLEIISKKIVLSLIDIFLFNNYENFDYLFRPSIVEDGPNDILDNSIFFLSDENKSKYMEEFIIRLLDDKIVLDRENTSKFKDILLYTDFDVDVNLENDIISKIAEQIEFKDLGSGSIADDISYNVMQRDLSDEKTKRIKEIYEKIRIMHNEIKEKNFIHKFKHYYEECKYSLLSELIKSLETDKNLKQYNRLIDYIEKNNFLIPDLSKNIEYETWYYSHHMAKFSCYIEKSISFIEMAKQTCLENLNNKSLISRMCSLIKNNINSSYNLEEELKITNI